jgi:hypothetical protein
VALRNTGDHFLFADKSIQNRHTFFAGMLRENRRFVTNLI